VQPEIGAADKDERDDDEDEKDPSNPPHHVARRSGEERGTNLIENLQQLVMNAAKYRHGTHPILPICSRPSIPSSQ
jgi:hypothetical protein